MKSRRRYLWLVLLAVLVAYVGRGFSIRSYQPERSDRYQWGAFHVHSSLSDGLDPVPAIAEQALAARTDFILLTDHGAPHPEASLLRETVSDVRFIGGLEVGVADGHLIVVAPETVPPFKLPRGPTEAVRDIEAWGGLSVVTYPEDPETGWDYWGEDFVPNGLEIINITSYFRASTWPQRLRWALFLPFNHHYYLKAIRPPDYALERWDEFLERAPVWGFYASNAHGGFAVTESYRPRIPSYASTFAYVGLGVPLDADPERSIRAGNFFALVRGAGEPQRFEFGARTNGEIHPAGSRVEGPASVFAEVEVKELVTRLVVKRDGLVVSDARERSVSVETAAPGVYRAEVYLPEHPLLHPGVPWIVSNPIFIDVEFQPLVPPPRECVDIETIPLAQLQVEADDESETEWDVTATGGELRYQLSQTTPDKVDRWVALALRRPLTLSKWNGFFIEAESDEPMRYWLEVRAGYRSYQTSVAVGPDRPNRISLPFSEFYKVFGKRTGLPEERIDSLFLTVSTSNTRTGFSSRLVVRKLGLCRL